jgi:hypothetical protein
MLIVVHTHFSPEAILLMDDHTGITQQVTVLTASVANEHLSDIIRRMDQVSDLSGLEQVELRLLYVQRLTALPGHLSDATKTFLRGYPSLQVESRFMSATEIMVEVTGSRFAAPSIKVH